MTHPGGATEAFDAWQEQGEAYQLASEEGAWQDDPSEAGIGQDEVTLLRKVSPDQVELTCSVCGSWYAIVLSDAEDGGGSQDGIFRHYLSEHPESVQASAIRQWLEEE